LLPRSDKAVDPPAGEVVGDTGGSAAVLPASLGGPRLRMTAKSVNTLRATGAMLA
jgi:hypothetical protein